MRGQGWYGPPELTYVRSFSVISSAPPQMAPGDTHQIVLKYLNELGREVGLPFNEVVRYTSDTPARHAVSSTGLVTAQMGLTNGTSIITVIVGRLPAQTITYGAATPFPVVDHLVASPSSVAAVAGTPITITIVADDVSNQPITGRTIGTQAGYNAAVASPGAESVVGTGHNFTVTLPGAGTTTIVFEDALAVKTVSVTFTVSAIPVGGGASPWWEDDHNYADTQAWVSDRDTTNNVNSTAKYNRGSDVLVAANNTVNNAAASSHVAIVSVAAPTSLTGKCGRYIMNVLGTELTGQPIKRGAFFPGQLKPQAAWIEAFVRLSSASRGEIEFETEWLNPPSTAANNGDWKTMLMGVQATAGQLATPGFSASRFDFQIGNGPAHNIVTGPPGNTAGYVGGGSTWWPRQKSYFLRWLAYIKVSSVYGVADGRHVLFLAAPEASIAPTLIKDFGNVVIDRLGISDCRFGDTFNEGPDADHVGQTITWGPKRIYRASPAWTGVSPNIP